MAQTKRRRRTKHRANAAGVVETRGRTGRRAADCRLHAMRSLGATREATLRTPTQCGHSGAGAPGAQESGAPVYCRQLEVPRLAVIMGYVRFPGFGPCESYDADETVEGGEHL